MLGGDRDGYVVERTRVVVLLTTAVRRSLQFLLSTQVLRGF